MCNPTSQKLCQDSECQICFNKSFASHHRAICWSEKNDISPRQVFKSTAKQFWFECEVCRHEFKKKMYHVTDNSWCPYCAIPSKLLCTDESCLACFNRSFKSHPKSNCWSDKNSHEPRNVLKSSCSKYIFCCDVCDHEFEAILYTINSGNWCPFCSSKRLCGEEECATCYNKSFKSHPDSKYWSEKNDISPRQVFKTSNRKFIFCCKNGHEFNSIPGNIVGGRFCKYCTKKGEGKLFDKLVEFGYAVRTQVNFNWCKNINYLPFDFVIDEYKLIIELDGRQHFTQVSNWTSPEQTQKTDLYKMKVACEQGYTVIRLLQEDVYYDRNNWWGNLEQHIYEHTSPTLIYISDGDEYACFK